MRPLDHALEFILPIDPRYGIRSIAKRLWHAAATDERIACKFATIQERMGIGKSLITKEHYELYQRLQQSIPPLDIPTAPDWIRPAIAAAYLRAKAVVASGQVHGLFDNIERSLDTVLELVGKVESSFVGELLAETMLAAYEDREFRRALTEGANEFRALVNDLYGPEGTDRPAALRRMANEGDCRCCRDGTCEPCSCWIIIIIIIIVVKRERDIEGHGK